MGKKKVQTKRKHNSEPDEAMVSNDTKKLSMIQDQNKLVSSYASTKTEVSSKPPSSKRIQLESNERPMPSILTSKETINNKQDPPQLSYTESTT